MALSCDSPEVRPRLGDMSALLWLLLLLLEFSNLAKRLRTPPEAGRAAIVYGIQCIVDVRLVFGWISEEGSSYRRTDGGAQ